MVWRWLGRFSPCGWILLLFGITTGVPNVFPSLHSMKFFTFSKEVWARISFIGLSTIRTPVIAKSPQTVSSSYQHHGYRLQWRILSRRCRHSFRTKRKIYYHEKIFLLIVMAAALSGTPLFAQEKKLLPQNSRSTSQLPRLTWSRRESKDVTVTINRSKSYSKADVVLGLSTSLPKGITITYEPAEGLISSSIAKITADEDAQAGNYTIILSGEIRNKKKGGTLKLVVGGSDPNLSANWKSPEVGESKSGSTSSW